MQGYRTLMYLKNITSVAHIHTFAEPPGEISMKNNSASFFSQVKTINYEHKGEIIV